MIIPHRYLLYFSKTGLIKYTSHLDLLHIFTRALLQSNLKIFFSQGFNPKPRISVSIPLQVGIEGLNEILELYLAEPYSSICNELNTFIPSGLKLFKETKISIQYPSIQSVIEWSEYEITSDSFSPSVSKKISDIQNNSSLLVNFYDHQGKVKNFDLVKSIMPSSNDKNSNSIRLILQQGLNSTFKLSFLLEYLNLDFSKCSVMRKSLLTSKKTPIF